MRKILTILLVGTVLTIGAWGVYKINLKATSTFSNAEYERSNVDYDKIKADTGLDIEELTKDETMLKTYDTQEGVIVVVGNYSINLNETYIGRVFLSVMDGIDYGLECFKNFITEI